MCAPCPEDEQYTHDVVVQEERQKKLRTKAADTLPDSERDTENYRNDSVQLEHVSLNQK